MEEILNIDGKQYKITTSEILNSAQKAEVIRQIRTDCKTCGNKSQILNPATGCGITIKTGTSKTIGCTASGGTGRYSYVIKVDGSQVNPVNSGQSGSYTYVHTFNTVGSHTVSLTATDDCVT